MKISNFFNDDFDITERLVTVLEFAAILVDINENVMNFDDFCEVCEKGSLYRGMLTTALREMKPVSIDAQLMIIFEKFSELNERYSHQALLNSTMNYLII